MVMTPWNFVNTHTMSAVDLQLQNEAPSYGSRWIYGPVPEPGYYFNKIYQGVEGEDT